MSINSKEYIVIHVGTNAAAAIMSNAPEPVVPDGFFIVKKDFVGKFVRPRPSCMIINMIDTLSSIGLFVPPPASASHSLLGTLGFAVGKFVPAPVNSSVFNMISVENNVGVYIVPTASASVNLCTASMSEIKIETEE